MKKLKVTINGVSYQVEVEEIQEKAAVVPRVSAPSAPVAPTAPTISAPAAQNVVVQAGESTVTAPMPGKVTKVMAQKDQTVKQGEVLLLLEAMKMQNEICAPIDGKIKSIHVDAGTSVKNGDIMIVLK